MDKTTEKMQLFFAQIRKNLLVFAEDEILQQNIQAALQSSVQRLIIYKTPEESRNGLRSLDFHQIILEDCPAGHQVLTEINNWTGEKRRFIHTVFIGDKARSFDSKAAFLLGVDNYLHKSSIKQLEKYFEQSQKQFLFRNRPWIQEGDFF